MTPGEFQHQLGELRDIIVEGIEYFSVWRSLVPEDPDSAAALNYYWGLFSPAYAALLSTALLQFAKVFDPDPRTVSFRKLLTAAEKNPKLLTPYATSGQLQDLQDQIGAKEDVLGRLIAYRNQRLAHHDASPTRDQTLLYGEMRQLVEDVKSMYNSLLNAHDGNYFLFSLSGDEAKRHTTEVVRILREEMERAAQRIAEAYAAEGIYAPPPSPDSSLRSE